MGIECANRMSIWLSLLVYCSVARGQCIEYTGACQANWMSGLPNSVWLKPITELKLMMSHDSGAYALDLDATPPMERNVLLDQIVLIAKKDYYANKFIRQVTFTQGYNVFQQLEQGIRGFDFRVIYSSKTNGFYVAHSFATVPLVTVLSDIRRFMNKNTHEILLIEMSNDYEHSGKTKPYNDQIVATVQHAIGDLLLDVSNGGQLDDSITIESMVRKGRRIIFSFGDFLSQTYRNVWPETVVEGLWPNGQNVTQSLSVISGDLYRYNKRNPVALNSVSFTITPSKNSIIIGLLGKAMRCTDVDYSVFESSKKMNAASMQYIQEHQSQLAGVNVFAVDFPSDDYVQQIINLN